MNQRARFWMIVSLVLLVAAATEVDAARSRRREGGNAARGRNRGEALAQTFYERAVDLGKKGQYGQAAALMDRAVEKNGSNEKYRYYLSLLLYKRGDFGQAQQHLKLLHRGRVDRYRKKALALGSRIDKILRGEVELVRPVAAQQPGDWKPLDTLPAGAYVNVAGEAARISAGQGGEVRQVHGAVLTPSEYRNRRQEHMMAMRSRPRADSARAEPSSSALARQVEAAAERAVDTAEADAEASEVVEPPAATPASAPPAPAESPAVTEDHMRPFAPEATEPSPPDPDQMAATAMDSADEWASPEPTPVSPPPEPTRVASSSPSEEPAGEFGEDAFGDGFGAFEGEDTSASEPPTDNPFLEEPDEPAPSPEPTPAAEPPPPEPAASGDEEFGDFGDFGEDAFATGTPAASPKPAEEQPADEFSEFDEDVFEDF